MSHTFTIRDTERSVLIFIQPSPTLRSVEFSRANIDGRKTYKWLSRFFLYRDIYIWSSKNHSTNYYKYGSFHFANLHTEEIYMRRVWDKQICQTDKRQAITEREGRICPGVRRLW